MDNQSTSPMRVQCTLLKFPDSSPFFGGASQGFQRAEFFRRRSWPMHKLGVDSVTECLELMAGNCTVAEDFCDFCDRDFYQFDRDPRLSNGLLSTLGACPIQKFSLLQNT